MRFLRAVAGSGKGRIVDLHRGSLRVVRLTGRIIQFFMVEHHRSCRSLGQRAERKHRACLMRVRGSVRELFTRARFLA